MYYGLPCRGRWSLCGPKTTGRCPKPVVPAGLHRPQRPPPRRVLRLPRGRGRPSRTQRDFLLPVQWHFSLQGLQCLFFDLLLRLFESLILSVVYFIFGGCNRSLSPLGLRRAFCFYFYWIRSCFCLRANGFKNHTPIAISLCPTTELAPGQRRSFPREILFYLCHP